MSPSEPVPLEEGSTLGRYVLTRYLGKGGMGKVFVARDKVFGDEVALKYMLPMEPHLQEEAKKRFFREAKLALSLRDRSRDRIVKVLDVNEDRGVPFLAMEYLKGQALDAYLIEHHVPDLSFTLKLALQVAEGLAIAHEAGLIHRDIKPQNIWIEDLGNGDWRCKILDFGLAKAMQIDDGYTKTGAALGTGPFMSPEQWRGRDVDHRTDLFSLGVLLFRLLAGELPFRAELYHEYMFQICFEAPKQLLELKPNLSPPLAELIHGLLEKKKEDRPATAQTFIDRLSAIYKAPGTDLLPAEVRIDPREQKDPIQKLRQPLDCTGPDGADEPTVKRVQANWAEALGLPVETSVDLGGGVRMEFVLIPPGKFWMGSTEADIDLILRLFPDSKREWFTDEMPQHIVTISQPFYLGKSAVTRGQFGRFVQAKSFVTEPERSFGGWGWSESERKFIGPNKRFSWKETGWPADDLHPVVNVTWNDAVSMCDWLSSSELKLPTQIGSVRLCREAEWEYACRAGTRTLYPNDSNDPERLVEIGNVADGTKKAKWPSWPTIKTAGGFLFTAPVGCFRPNAFSLYDMIGNVWEWCQDGYDPRGYRAKGRIYPYTKPLIQFIGSARYCLRGGSFHFYINPCECHSAARNKEPVNYRGFNLGFRVLLPLDQITL